MNVTEEARRLGFTLVAALEPEKLEPNRQVREMCAADKCHAYGKNWTCPPLCGDLEDCARRIHGCAQGLLLQTVGQLEDSFDVETMMETEEAHRKRFHALADLVRAAHKDALCLGTGGCRICSQCAYPQPCRFPERACASMEGYGLLVSQVCADAGVPYYHGQNTITYTACILYNP